MAQLTVEIPDKLAEEAKQLSREELNFLIEESLKQKLPEKLMFRLVGRIREKSSLTEEHVQLLSDELKRAVAKRHGLK